ncbi:hypothetical protein T484DRAFT_1757452 [Baffinella frigidus]|nr:hypothetical protein T484DRAFT_1757452 [Cryptophyta sp. CCMP2293]
MDNDTTSVEMEEEIEDCDNDAKKEKTKSTKQKHKCKHPDCNASRRNPCELQWHVDFIHNKRFNYVCDHIIDEEKGTTCGHKCERPQALEQHKQNKHIDARPYKCTDCSKAFKQAGELKQHKHCKHSDARPYKCKDCPETFKQAQACDNHWNAKCSPIGHPARTKYKCKACEKGFPTNTNRYEHYLYNCAPKDDPAREALLRASRRKNHKRRTKERAKRAALHAKRGGASSAFGQIEGVSRDKEIAELIALIMEGPAGSCMGSSGEATTAKWKEHHGNASLRDVLLNLVRTFAVYFCITRQDIKPGEEGKCSESFAFLHQKLRDPLWRIETDSGDLRRFTYGEAKSVCETYVLRTSDNPYDITSLEAETQYYIEDLGMAHGVRLHQKAGAGSRLPGSETEKEKTCRAKDGTIIYSLAVTLIETHNQIFADEVDPKDPTPMIPRLLSATVVGRKKGAETALNVVVRGHKKPFRDTPSVLADQKDVKRMQKNNRVTTKKRHAARKSATSTPNQDTKSCIQEPLKKKQKTGTVQLVP